MNQGAQFVRHLQNMIVLARVIAQGRAQPRRVARSPLQARVSAARRRGLACARRSRFTRRPPDGAPDSVRYVRALDYTSAAAAVHVTDEVDITSSGPARASTRRPERPARSAAAAPRASRAAPPAVADHGESLMARTEGPAARSSGRTAPRSRATGRSSTSPWQPHMNVISALMEIQKKPGHRRRARGHAGRVGVRLPRRGVRGLHDGHQRARCGSRAAR